MRLKYNPLILVLVTPLLLLAQTRWQTTREGRSSGNCRLESNSIRITVHPFHLDVEEEAVIRTLGNVGWGDEKTLEITGQFRMTSGTAIRSLLLWNGDVLLKGKLRERTAADSAYEEVVDRNLPQVRPKDPALIEHIGNNSYRFKIYPVAINEARKIRILYTVPLKTRDSGPLFGLRSAFTYGCYKNPGEIPVTVIRGNGATHSYKMAIGTNRKVIRFGATYLIEYDEILTVLRNGYHADNSISIIPDSTAMNRCFTHHIDSGKKAGHYTAVFASVPDTLQTTIDQYLPNEAYTIESWITAGDKSWVSKVPYSGGFGVYVKSSQPWDRDIHYCVYNAEGNPVIEYTVPFGIDAESDEESTEDPTPTDEDGDDDPIEHMLPLVWAAKYTLDEQKGNMGALFGFVDPVMSLLALEDDSLSRDAAAPWLDNGVPPLEPDEIIIGEQRIPEAPEEAAFFEYHNTSVTTFADNLATTITVDVLPGGMLLIHLNDMQNQPVSFALFSLNGRLIKQWHTDAGISASIQVPVPREIRGTFLLSCTVGNRVLKRKVVIP